MKRNLRPEEKRLWSVVTATVRPAHGLGTQRGAAQEVSALLTAAALSISPPAPTKKLPPGKFKKPVKTKAAAATPKPVLKPPQPQIVEPEPIEPSRHRRIARERDPLDRRLDLHGMDQDRARRTLIDFLLRAHDEGTRAVLVITGKGSLGEGVLRRRAPDWLAEPVLREVVAGVSPADRRHGGDGALYVALKRRR